MKSNPKDENQPRINQLNEQLRQFILPLTDDVYMFSHRTQTEEVANKIMHEGFIFSDSFQKTTDQIVDDIVYIRYWDSLRKYYGGFVVVIGISKKLFEIVTDMLQSKHEVQQALSKVVKQSNEEEEGDHMFVLPHQYIKGFIKRESGEIKSNPLFNPDFLPEYLNESIEFLNSDRYQN